MLAAFFLKKFLSEKYTKTREGTMKRKKKYHWGIKGLLLCAAVCAIFLTGNSIKAEAFQNNSLDYSVRPIMPESQRNDTQAYFDLLMNPGEEQTLQIEVVNHAEEDKTINVSVATASTNGGGNVDYGVRANVEADDTLLYKIDDLVSTQGRIVVPAKETYTVQLKVMMPSASFDGILAGGINFKEVSNGEDAEIDQEGGVAIQNEYSYVIALLLRVNDQEVLPDLQLNQVYAAQRNWMNIISANVQNFKSAYVTNMNISAQVRRQGETDVLYELDKKDMEMAPNSNFNYAIPLNGEPFQAGTYVLSLAVESSEGSWDFEREFIITPEEAKAFNETDVSIERSNLWIYIAAGAGILLLVLLIFLLVWYKKRAKKQKIRLREIIEEIILRLKGNG